MASEKNQRSEREKVIAVAAFAASKNLKPRDVIKAINRAAVQKRIKARKHDQLAP